ncbi:MAG: hypothetical protein DRH51_08450 [Candidatus Coatesbacteria bacterium]|nr:MAG: hypothetical protein DRH51_08450 [Candidatus Coatesbacteria bacterium]
MKSVAERAYQVYFGVIKSFRAQCVEEEKGLLQDRLQFLTDRSGKWVMKYEVEEAGGRRSSLRIGNSEKPLIWMYELSCQTQPFPLMLFQCNRQEMGAEFLARCEAIFRAGEGFETFSIPFPREERGVDALPFCLEFCQSLKDFVGMYLSPYFIFKEGRVKFRYPSGVISIFEITKGGTR